MKPVIGITSTLVKLNEFSEGVYVHQDYYRGVEACGGFPLILPTTEPETCKRLIDLCDGVIFSGGEDVDPQFYGAEPHQHLGPLLPKRDKAEIVGVHYVIEQQKPLLAICRGIQVLNVALGGTLYQDLPSEYPNALQHSQKSARPLDTHWVDLAEDSRLQGIFGHNRVRVNSLHHQALKDVADTLRVTGTASDGVIEAVEYAGPIFTVGVQWHPESMWERDPLMKALFYAFVNECKESAEAKRTVPVSI